MPRLAHLASAAAAALLVLLTISAASPARADETDCVDTRFASGGYELFDLETHYVPPPLRGFDFDCAARLISVGDEDGAKAQSQYVLLYTEASVDLYVSMIQSFERAGWIDGPAVSYIDGEGVRDSAPVDSSALAAVGADVQWASARFSNARTGLNIVSMTYTDGVNSENDPALTSPSILIDIFVNEDYDATGLADPSVLSTLKTIRDAAITPTQGVVLGGSAIMLMLIVGYPGSLLGSVVGARYDTLAAAVRKRWRRAAGDPELPRKRLPRWMIWPGFVAAALIGGFVDPAFGLNLMSLRVLVSGLLGFLVFNLGVWTLVKVIVRRVQPDARPYIRFRWGSLVVVAIAVVVARLLEFNPGVIFGLVAGLAFGMTLALSKDALVVLLGSGFGLVAAAIGWIGYSLLATVKGDNAFTVFVAEFFSGLTIEGISTLPLALLPFARLDGATLLKWKKWVWAIAYAFGLAAFMLVLFTVPGSWGEIPGDFLRWISLFLAFGVVAMAIWAIDNYLARRRVRKTGTEEEHESELSGS
jgi:hypothetical protein